MALISIYDNNPGLREMLYGQDQSNPVRISSREENDVIIGKSIVAVKPLANQKIDVRMHVDGHQTVQEREFAAISVTLSDPRAVNAFHHQSSENITWYGRDGARGQDIIETAIKINVPSVKGGVIVHGQTDGVIIYCAPEAVATVLGSLEEMQQVAKDTKVDFSKVQPPKPTGNAQLDKLGNLLMAAHDLTYDGIQEILKERGAPLVNAYGTAIIINGLSDKNQGFSSSLAAPGVVDQMTPEFAAMVLELSVPKDGTEKLVADILESKKVDVSGPFGQRLMKLAVRETSSRNTPAELIKAGVDVSGQFGIDLLKEAAISQGQVVTHMRSLVPFVKDGTIKVSEKLGQELYAIAHSDSLTELVRAGVPDPDKVAQADLREYVKNAYWSHPVKHYLEAGLRVDNEFGAELRALNNRGGSSQNRTEIDAYLTAHGAPGKQLVTQVKTGTQETTQVTGQAQVGKIGK